MFWETVNLMVVDTILKILIFAPKPEFYKWKQILSAVSFQVAGSKKCLPNTQRSELPNLSVSHTFK